MIPARARPPSWACSPRWPTRARRPTVPRDGLPAGAIPGPDAIGVAIYAGNLTTGQVLAGLAAAAGIEDINPDPAALGSGLTRLLAGLRGSGPSTGRDDRCPG